MPGNSSGGNKDPAEQRRAIDAEHDKNEYQQALDLEKCVKKK